MNGLDQKKLKEFLSGVSSEAQDSTDFEEHDKAYHPGGYREGDKCKYREAAKLADNADGTLLRLWEFTGETKKIRDVTVRRIRASRDFEFGNGKKIRKGDAGGWIEKGSNLSGNAWVGSDSYVYGNAKVYGNAMVVGHSEVFGNARVHGNATISGDLPEWGEGGLEVRDDAEVYGEAMVYGWASLYGHAKVFDKASVCGDARIGDHSVLCGKSRAS